MALPAEYGEAFDKLRTQLSQLSTSISLLKVDLERHDPLPSWPALQSSAATLGSHLTAVNSALGGYKTLLATAHAYPLPNFPGHSQELLLQQLLRKKLDPRAEEWIEESQDQKHGIGNGNPVDESSQGVPFSTGDIEELLGSAGPTANRIVKRLIRNGRFDDDYTIAERREGAKNTATGLKRKLGRRPILQDEDDEDEDLGTEENAEEVSDDELFEDEVEDDDDERMDEDDGTNKVNAGADSSSAVATAGIDASQPPLPLSSLLKFTSAGETSWTAR